MQKMKYYTLEEVAKMLPVANKINDLWLDHLMGRYAVQATTRMDLASLKRRIEDPHYFFRMHVGYGLTFAGHPGFRESIGRNVTV